MITAQVERITPEIAAAMLQCNVDNRRLSETLITQYASDMASGRWKMTGQPIIVADDGELNDGQHRLAAVVKAGVAVDVMVIRGALRSTRDAIDTGKSRTSGDVLQMFHIPDGNAVAALAQIVISWERAGKSRVGGRNLVSKGDVIARAKVDHRLVDATRLSAAAGKITTRKHVAFARYVIADSARSDEFFARLIDGAGLMLNNPILTVRHWFMRNGRRVPDAQAIEALLRAWCAFRDGRDLSRIQLMGELPTP